MQIAVVIPSKTISNLVPCVRAVRASEPGVAIIWVDDRHEKLDRSTEDDGHAKVSRAAGLPFITTVSGDEPFVFSRNANLGLRAAFGLPIPDHPGAVGAPFDAAVLLNDDALLKTPGGFTRLAEIAAQHEDIGIIAPVTNVTGQPLQMPKRIGLRQVPHIAFVCVLIPRRTWQTVGPLDERYCLDYGVEDRDYCEAVNRAGLKVCVHDDVFVDHGSLVSSFRGDPKTPRPYTQNYALFKQKWGLRV